MPEDGLPVELDRQGRQAVDGLALELVDDVDMLFRVSDGGVSGKF